MPRQYSVTEARNHFNSLVEEVEKGAAIELTRYGKPVAVLLPFQKYRRLTTYPSNFWEAYTAFIEQVNLQDLDIGSDIWADIRCS